MSTSSKSPRRVALAAMAVAKESLPSHPHRFAPKKFNEHQLFACLVLMRFFKTSYRGIHAYLQDMPTLCEDMGLTKVPHYTTIQQAARRLLSHQRTHRLLARSNELLAEVSKPPPKGRRAAADGTGLTADRRSAYYTQRRKQSGERVIYRRFPKLTLLIDIDNHMVLSMLRGRGPRPDVQELVPLLDALPRGLTVRHVYADAGFDSESNHTYAREEHGIITTIPPGHGRPSKDNKPPAGRYRRMMKETFGLRKQAYGQRWQVETVNSMFKRNQGDHVAGASYWSQQRELAMVVLTHNVAIVE